MQTKEEKLIKNLQHSASKYDQWIFIKLQLNVDLIRHIILSVVESLCNLFYNCNIIIN